MLASEYVFTVMVASPGRLTVVSVSVLDGHGNVFLQTHPNISPHEALPNVAIYRFCNQVNLAVNEVSEGSRIALRSMLDALCRTVHQHYIENNMDVAERYGNLVLLLSNIYVRFILRNFLSNKNLLFVFFLEGVL